MVNQYSHCYKLSSRTAQKFGQIFPFTYRNFSGKLSVEKPDASNFWPMKKVLLSDIAEKCSVSISTVSRTLSGDTSRRINALTRKKILQCASDLGYYTSRQINQSSLATLKTAILFLSDHESIGSPFFSQIVEGIREEAERLGDVKIELKTLSIYDSDFFTSFEDGDFDLAILLGRVRKDVLSRVMKSEAQLIYAGLNRIENVDCVLADSMEGIKELVCYLHSLGHEKIAFLGPCHQEDLVNEYRFEGYLEGLALSGLDYSPSLVCDCYLSAEDGYEKTGLLFEKSRPSAIVCANDILATGTLRYLEDHGIDCPGEVSVTGFDNIEASAFLKPALTTMDVPKKELGRFALSIALDRRKSGRDYTLRLNLPFSLIERESTKEARHV